MAMKGFVDLVSLKSSMPRASISKGGKVSINEAAVIAYKLIKFKYAKLLYNERLNILGLAFSEKAPNENGLVIQPRERSGIWVAGKSALSSIGVIPQATSVYPLERYEDSDCEFMIRLNEGRARKKKKI
jgi:hypothetical protein